MARVTLRTLESCERRWLREIDRAFDRYRGDPATALRVLDRLKLKLRAELSSIRAQLVEDANDG